MVEESLITPALKDLLGKELETEYFEVEKGHIRRFAQAIGDPSPLFSDAEYARTSRHGGIIAPPTFLMDRGLNRIAYMIMDKKHPSAGFLNGGIEIEYYQPMKVGDVIASTARLADLKEKTSPKGKLLFLQVEVIYKNQRGELVRKFRNTFITPQNN